MGKIQPKTCEGRELTKNQLGDVEFGGYLVGRTSGHRQIKMKALAQIAGGAKNLRYYTFGPGT